jgi:carboxyl-terminal processing protease
MPIDLSDGAELRLTIARYYTPSGRSIQKPYGEDEDYSSDWVNRFEHGEFFTADSIKFDDSLR